MDPLSGGCGAAAAFGVPGGINLGGINLGGINLGGPRSAAKLKWLWPLSACRRSWLSVARAGGPEASPAAVLSRLRRAVVAAPCCSGEVEVQQCREEVRRG